MIEAAITSNGFAKCTLKNETLIEQFANEQARYATTNVHQSRQVSARDWLVGTNEVERDLAIDFATGTAPGHFEVVWIDLSHLNCLQLGLIKTCPPLP